MHAEKNKGADQFVQLNSWSALLFFSKSNHRFYSLSQDTTFAMPRILKYVKITMYLQLIFKACAVIVVLLCFRVLQYLSGPPCCARPGSTNLLSSSE